MVKILILVYSIWAIYSGFMVLSGRLEWLDRKAPVNIAIKIILSIVIGYMIAALYLIYLTWKFVEYMSKE